ncbi:uncharacterized protein LOC141673829 [Apium graveolens]|uniref:uncharacterized protein LOC141673829 n=1 Tax=Apium graveolens TaxID=4045 RepID=UPI003D78E559
MSNYHLQFSLIFLIAIIRGVVSIDYNVTDVVSGTPGGIRFEKEIGVDYSIQEMGTINQFIYTLFDQQNNPNDRRPQNFVQLYIDVHADEAAAVTSGNIINMSSIFIQNYDGDVKWGFTSILYHEMTHVFQWLPSNAPNGLIEGMADYTMLKANYFPPGQAKPGDGDSWDQGYDVTARFLEYCESLLDNFVAQLNKKMKYSYNDRYFSDLIGKSVDQLWQEYKDKYKHNV